MGRSPVDLVRKLIKYHQHLKIVRRSLQVRYANLDSSRPDFGVGPFQVKPSSEYSLILNVDLPKSSGSLIVDFWGTHPHGKLDLLNRYQVNLVNRDQRIKFWTYPKTKQLAITFSVQPNQEGEERVIQYMINYLFIESKEPIPRSLTSGDPDFPRNNIKRFNLWDQETQTFSFSDHRSFHYEISPRNLMELSLDPDQIYPKDVRQSGLLPLKLEIFGPVWLNYLLNHQNNPVYLRSLINNMKNCNLELATSEQNLRQIDQEDISELRETIRSDSEQLEKQLSLIDNLLYHKHSIENKLESPDKSIEINRARYQQHLRGLSQLIEGLNLRLNYLNNLIDLSNENENQGDREKMGDILGYYKARVIKDRLTLHQEHQRITGEMESFEQDIYQPKHQQINSDQDRLEQILNDYRKIKEDVTKLKEKLDGDLSRFFLMYCQYVAELNRRIKQ